MTSGDDSGIVFSYVQGHMCTGSATCQRMRVRRSEVEEEREREREEAWKKEKGLARECEESEQDR